MTKELDTEALAYHRAEPAGKLAIVPTKALSSQRDLSLAYSPGVAAACEAIRLDPEQAFELTARNNLVAVITNGTAVLGLGNIGPLAAKPVMEGKAVLFKSFAGVDAINLEINETDVSKFVTIVAALGYCFGGINLEDIRAPDCFEIEKELQQRISIPVFHDDQHGTAIVVAAAVLNGLQITGKQISGLKITVNGAGAAALACLDLLLALGADKRNIIVCDREGVVNVARKDKVDIYTAAYASESGAVNLQEALEDADLFLGLSAPDTVKPEWLETMAKDPMVFALANPIPEIMPEAVRGVRGDAIIATGRSDYPNQVNNVLCFPFLFRGALDVGATRINQEMKMAAASAIARLARREAGHEVSRVYAGSDLSFGREYLIPKPFDTRLITEVSLAVAKAAVESGVAGRPVSDWQAYRDKLSAHGYRASIVLKPIFDITRNSGVRIAYSNGEDERILETVQIILEEKTAEPVIIGRRRVVEARIKRLGLRYALDKDVQLVDPEGDPRYREYWQHYHRKLGRQGVTPDVARDRVRTSNTVIGALMVDRGDSDGLIGGGYGQFRGHLDAVQSIIGADDQLLAAMMMLVLPGKLLFIVDTHVATHEDPENLCRMAKRAATEVARFGVRPKLAFLSYSNFGSAHHPGSARMRAAVSLFKERHPDIDAEGEMQADTALDPGLRSRLLEQFSYSGAANTLIMPNVDSVNILYNGLKVVANGLAVGPLLLGCAKPAHILTSAFTPRSLVSLTAITASQILSSRQWRQRTAS